jgi:hypothetical protein
MSAYDSYLVWRWPAALALLSASGLFSALMSEGLGDVWAWIALGTPLAVAARHVIRKP